ncbi:MAG: tRNA(Ile)-lysidine synthetase, partial [Desulfitobacterium hafniense]|nr:tRNA(Ile)-lysidine synthetase [Desulfitobacterium hafniense]
MFHKLSAEVLPKLIPKGSKILVAVSGGPDSISLGHILWRYSLEESHNLTLVLTHVNHGVRPESEAEAGMVSDLALKWGVKCLVHKFDAKAYSKECGESFQAAAREW